MGDTLLGTSGIMPIRPNKNSHLSDICAPTLNQYFTLSVSTDISFKPSFFEGIGLYDPSYENKGGGIEENHEFMKTQ